MGGWTKTGKPIAAKGNRMSDYRRRRKNVRRGRSKYEVKEVASLTEVQLPLGATTANQSYSSYNISLASCPRARDVAKGYQFYRIKRITYVIKPLMDTFVQGTGSPQTQATVPYLYYMVDRTRQFQAGFTLAQLKAMGAKARRLDDKILTFSYTPSVLTETFDNTANATTAAQYKLSPWLPCKDIAGGLGVWNPSTTDHLGIVWRVEQELGNAIGYSIERRVQLEFKKPAMPTTAGTELDVPIDFEDIQPLD